MAPAARGQDLFLAYSSQLEQTLRPCLSADDRLGLTCKALHKWILGTPLSLWQAGFGQFELCCNLSATSWPRSSFRTLP